MVTSYKFKQESEYTVRNKVQAHIMLKIVLEEQECEYSEQYKEECSLIKHCGMYRMRVPGECNSKEAIGRYTVAAACKEAAKSAECVCDSDAAGRDRQKIDDSAAELIPCNKV